MPSEKSGEVIDTGMAVLRASKVEDKLPNDFTVYTVASKNKKGEINEYFVSDYGRRHWVCTCPAFVFNPHKPCKHIALARGYKNAK